MCCYLLRRLTNFLLACFVPIKNTVFEMMKTVTSWNVIDPVYQFAVAQPGLSVLRYHTVYCGVVTKMYLKSEQTA